MRNMDVLLGFRTALAVLITLSGVAIAEESAPAPLSVPQEITSSPKGSRPAQPGTENPAKPTIQPVSQHSEIPPAPPVISHPGEETIEYMPQTVTPQPMPGSYEIYPSTPCSTCEQGACQQCDCESGHCNKCYGWVNGCQNCEDEAWSSKYCKRRWPGMNFFDKWFRQPWIKSHCIQPADCCESAKWYKYP